MAMVPDGQGGAFFVWRDQRNALTTKSDIYGQHLNANGVPLWPLAGLPICTADEAQIFPKVAPDANGGAYIIWQDSRNSSFATDVFAVHLNSAGAVVPGWTAHGTAVCISNQNITPLAVPDGSGGVFFAWFHAPTNVNASIRAVRYLSGGGVAAGFNPEGNQICPVSLTENFKELTGAADGAGGLLVAWQRESTTTGRDIWATRMRPAGALTWGPSGVLVCNAIGHQQYPRVVGDGSGGAIVSWLDHRAASQNGRDVYALRINSAGARAAGWQVNGNVACGLQTASDAAPQIVTDNAGGCFVAWNERARQISLDPAIYATRLSGNGTRPAGWFPNGNRAAFGDRFIIRDVCAVPDGAGGVFVAWTNAGNTPADVLAQRLTSAGTTAPGWPPNGRGICTLGTSSQSNNGAWFPGLVNNGPGTAIAGWLDERAGHVNGGTTRQIYAAQIRIVSLIKPVQKLAVKSLNGGGYQEMFYDYDSGASLVTPYSSVSQQFSYPHPYEHVLAAFHYDYVAGAFTQAAYFNGDVN